MVLKVYFYELAAYSHNISTQGNSPNHYATSLPSASKDQAGLQNQLCLLNKCYNF